MAEKNLLDHFKEFKPIYEKGQKMDIYNQVICELEELYAAREQMRMAKGKTVKLEIKESEFKDILKSLTILDEMFSKALRPSRINQLLRGAEIKAAINPERKGR